MQIVVSAAGAVIAVYADATTVPLASHQTTHSTARILAGSEIDVVMGDFGQMSLSADALARLLSPSNADLKSYLADKRWQVETAGTTLDLGGGVVMAVPTDRDGRAALKQARDMLRDGELLDEEGNVLTSMAVVIGDFAADLTEAQATAILKRAAQHVQLAFEVQKSAIAAIDAGTITTTAEIDAAAWPV